MTSKFSFVKVAKGAHKELHCRGLRAHVRDRRFDWQANKGGQKDHSTSATEAAEARFHSLLEWDSHTFLDHNVTPKLELRVNYNFSRWNNDNNGTIHVMSEWKAIVERVSESEYGVSSQVWRKFLRRRRGERWRTTGAAPARPPHNYYVQTHTCTPAPIHR